jgi:hypothetical protein
MIFENFTPLRLQGLLIAYSLATFLCSGLTPGFPFGSPRARVDGAFLCLGVPPGFPFGSPLLG